MKHKIEGGIIEQCKCNIISFLDTSEYIEGLEVTNPILQIFPPDWDKYFSIKYNLNGITILRPEHINHGSFPDGIYHFIQSICPNDKLINKFCYLNICCTRKHLASLICDYMNNEDKLEELYKLKMQLESSQDLVELGEVKKGTELFKITRKSLNRLKPCNIC